MLPAPSRRANGPDEGAMGAARKNRGRDAAKLPDWLRYARTKNAHES